MKKNKFCFLVLTLTLMLVGCSKTSQSTETNKYNTGVVLNIGVLGEISKTPNSKIKFSKIQFSDLDKEKLSLQYNAIFIIENKKISEETQSKYVNILKNSKIPFYFINIERPSVDDQVYAVGYLFSKNKNTSWGYGLENNIESEENIKDVYSKIFQDIETNTFPKSKK